MYEAKVMTLIALLWNEVQKHGCQLFSPSGTSKPKGVPFYASYPFCIIEKTQNKDPSAIQILSRQTLLLAPSYSSLKKCI